MTASAKGWVRVSEAQGSGVIYLRGKFAFSLQSEFRKAYEQLATKCRTLTIDLNEVDYMDSSGLGMLLVMKKYLDDATVSYELENVSGATLNLLQITHFNKYFKINGEALK